MGCVSRTCGALASPGRRWNRACEFGALAEWTVKAPRGSVAPGFAGTGDQPGLASEPGSSSCWPVADWVKSAPTGRTSAAVLGFDPVDSVAEWLKSAVTRAWPRASDLGLVLAGPVAEWSKPFPTGPGLGYRASAWFPIFRR
jgi:hypothetical protein